jgi:hypothetical protein
MNLNTGTKDHILNIMQGLLCEKIIAPLDIEINPPIDTNTEKILPPLEI